MSTVLYISTLVLCFSGIAFSFLCIWLNTFSKVSDIKSRSAGMLKIIGTSMVLSIVFAFLSCLINDSDNTERAIEKLSELYAIIAVDWLVVIVGCGIAMLITFVSKTKYRKETIKSIKRVFLIALIGGLLGMVLSWLLS